VFTIHGSSSHDAKAATFPVKAGLPFSHSSTVTLGFQFRLLLSIRGSANPASISL
jgi:hypothetical protein